MGPDPRSAHFGKILYLGGIFIMCVSICSSILAVARTCAVLTFTVRFAPLFGSACGREGPRFLIVMQVAVIPLTFGTGVVLATDRDVRALLTLGLCLFFMRGHFVSPK
ncbi:hypothetical protein AV944_08610 [Sphingomonas sp. LK11]|nr:hypothetical protein AV944_08610 [Sphingomonas sp. LK11]